MQAKKRTGQPDNSWKWMLSVTGIITIAGIILSIHAGLRPSGSGDIIGSLSGPASAEAAELLSKSEFTPPALCGFIINPQSETHYFDFVLDTGNGGVVDKEKLTPQTKELINYFFLGITLPAREFWVNLNPVDLNNIISPMLICTDTGKSLLETDLRLKRDAAMLTDPRLSCGKEYWDILKAELKEQNLSDAQIPANTRLWIIPEDAVLEEDKDNKNKVTLISAKLKVCLESEYSSDLSPAANPGQNENDRRIQEIASQAMKKVILPVIEFRVNHSKDYAQLRQIYHSLILAEYFKHKYWGKQSIYESYINTCSLTGLESPEQWSKQAIFDSYVQSMTKGEYSCIQQEYDPYQAGMIKKHYFSGGMQFDILPKGFAENIQEIPAIITLGEATTTWLAQATTRTGEKLVVDNINLLTPEEAAQRTAASPIEQEQIKQLTQSLHNMGKEINEFRKTIAESRKETDPDKIREKIQELIENQQTMDAANDDIAKIVDNLKEKTVPLTVDITIAVIRYAIWGTVSAGILALALKACSSPINQEGLKQDLSMLDQQAKQFQEQLAAISPKAEQELSQQKENTEMTSSPIREVGGIDLRKIRYRVVFSEG